MGRGAAEAIGLGFVCFVDINPHVLSANRVGLSFLFHEFSNFTPPFPSMESHEFQTAAVDFGEDFDNLLAPPKNGRGLSPKMIRLESQIILLSNISYKCDGVDGFCEIQLYFSLL
mgnify:CR=1 FL=1